MPKASGTRSHVLICAKELRAAPSWAREAERKPRDEQDHFHAPYVQEQNRPAQSFDRLRAPQAPVPADNVIPFSARFERRNVRRRVRSAVAEWDESPGPHDESRSAGTSRAVCAAKGRSYDFGDWLAQGFYEYLQDLRAYAPLLAVILGCRFVMLRLQGEPGRRAR
jgi:hypothetical protein